MEDRPLTSSPAWDERFPRISLVTPSFNHGGYLERAIQSVVNQRYPNLEYVVIDDGSTDDSLSIIQRHQRDLTHWERQPNYGFGHALNKGFSLTTGEIMGWLNADDVLMPNALAIVGQIFRDYPHINWITSGSINITHDDKLFVIQPSRKWFCRWTQLFLHAPPPQHCTFWRRRLWEVAGGYVIENSRYPDCELWLRFYEHARLYVVDTIFGAWRIHSTSHSTRHLRDLKRHIHAAQQGYVQRYLHGHWWLGLVWPLVQFYFTKIDRGILSRTIFELYIRRARFLTFNLRTGRFVLDQDKTVIPRPWPFTIEVPEGDVVQTSGRQ